MDAAELKADLVFVDLETTGASPAYDRIIEIGVVRMVDGVCVDSWQSLVNPERSIPANIESFTGIGSAMVEAAPTFRELAPTIMEKLRGATFVAHNARFDYAFLRREFAGLDQEFAATVLCTVKLSRFLKPEEPRHNLDALIERFRLRAPVRHRALADALVLAELWTLWQATLSPGVFDSALPHSLLKPPKLPDHLPQELPDLLPDGPGIYRYYGEDDALLYVGKALSLRSKVLSQLGDEHSGSRNHQLAEQTRRVEWSETAGELGAMLREAATVQQQKPRFNRARREQTDAVTWRESDSPGSMQLIRIDELEPAELCDTFGLFHSVKDAHKALHDIASARQLCLKTLGLEESQGSCLAFQLGKCKGACVGKEPLPLHAARAKMALTKLKLKSWPFPGRIALHEHTRFHDEVHVLDQWSYVGSARSEEELELLAERSSGAFDADIYKILVRYFSSHSRLDWRRLA